MLYQKGQQLNPFFILDMIPEQLLPPIQNRSTFIYLRGAQKSKSNVSGCSRMRSKVLCV